MGPAHRSRFRSRALLRSAIVLRGLGHGTGRAEAHFLFVRVLPPAEGGRSAEVYFSELAEAGDPRFVERIAHTQLWLQATPEDHWQRVLQQGGAEIDSRLAFAFRLCTARPPQPRVRSTFVAPVLPLP